MEVTCKLGEQGCWNDGKCRATCNCENKIVTNADRIRAMSDEELADWLARSQIDNITEACQIIGLEFTCEEGTLERTKAEVLKWLKQPAEVDNG